jgi:hypothetical protein
MVRAPRNLHQREAVRAFTKAGGVLRKSTSGHQVLKMPNGHIVSLPAGIIRVGLLQSEVRKSGLTMEQFMELL